MTFVLFARRPRGLPLESPNDLKLEPEEAPTLRDISVVVPVRDNPHGLARLMAWWHALGREQPLELIVVDDGSRTPVEAHGASLRILQGGGRGPACARNKGWRAAKGRWIAFL